MYIVKNIFISILIIYIAHTLWNYILDVCTTKKKKNLVQFQNEKYNAIIDRLQNEQEPVLGMTEEEIEEMKANLLKEIEVANHSSVSLS